MGFAGYTGGKINLSPDTNLRLWVRPPHASAVIFINVYAASKTPFWKRVGIKCTLFRGERMDQCKSAAHSLTWFFYCTTKAFSNKYVCPSGLVKLIEADPAGRVGT